MQRRTAESRHQPERHAATAHRCPTINHRIHVRRPHASESEPGILGQKFWVVQFHRRCQGNRRTEHQPHERGEKQVQHRAARRSVDLHALGAAARDLFVVRRLNFVCGHARQLALLGNSSDPSPSSASRMARAASCGRSNSPCCADHQKASSADPLKPSNVAKTSRAGIICPDHKSPNSTGMRA